MDFNIDLGGMIGGGFNAGIGGGMSLAIGGQVGMILQGIQTIAEGVKKLVDLVKDVSPALKGSFDILHKSFQLALKPMADAIGYALLPIARWILRQSIEWQKKTGFERAEILGKGGSFLDMLMGGVTPFGMIGELAGLITLKPQDLIKVEKGEKQIFNVFDFIGFSFPSTKFLINIFDFLDIRIPKIVLNVADWIVDNIPDWLKKLLGISVSESGGGLSGVGGGGSNIPTSGNATGISAADEYLNFLRERERQINLGIITPGTGSFTGGGVNW